MSPLFALSSALALLLAQADGGQHGRIDGSPHNFFGPNARAATDAVDLCQLCHVPSPLVSAARPPAAWAPNDVGRAAALDVRADPSGPPLALRWAGSTLRCMSCHDETVSSIGITFRPASASLVDDPLAGLERKAGARVGPTLLTPQWWTGEVMGNHPVSVPYPLSVGGFRGFLPRASATEATEWVDDPTKKGLKLLPDTSGFPDALSGTVGVECVSCHDPHGTANKFFLRLPKERSELCFGCHRK